MFVTTAICHKYDVSTLSLCDSRAPTSTDNYETTMHMEEAMFDKRVVLITGSSRGIGAATARLFAKHGAAVAVNYLNNAGAAERVVADITGAGGRAIAVQADVRVSTDVAEMVRTIGQRVGLIDTLVLNANIMVPLTPFIESPWDEFAAKVVGELQAAFYCVQAIVPGMMARKRGCIIAVSSDVSQHPVLGTSAHSTAKAALDALMRSLALELGPAGIRVNTIAPGLTLTDVAARLPEQLKQTVAGMTPLGRNAGPEDIAGAIVPLARDDAGFVTGNYVFVDGGRQVGSLALQIARVPVSAPAHAEG
jgi:3-oxoacyl-[acyl-carrier protein] reductase